MPSWNEAEERQDHVVVPQTTADATLLEGAQRLLEKLYSDLRAAIDPLKRSTKPTAAERCRG